MRRSGDSLPPALRMITPSVLQITPAVGMQHGSTKQVQRIAHRRKYGQDAALGRQGLTDTPTFGGVGQIETVERR
jgi:hypothetical protein